MSVAGDSVQEEAYDPTEHQPVYIFTSEHSTKRRKLSKSKKQAKATTPQTEPSYNFKPLFNGQESPECIELRQHIFHELWTSTENQIESILRDANERTLDEVTSFVSESIPALAQYSKKKIPTGLIVTGPNISSQELLFRQLADRLGTTTGAPIVTIRSRDVTNLRAVLKKIIRDATSRNDLEDEDEPVTGSQRQKGRKLLNYDLRNLQEYVQLHECRAVILAFQDSEAFESSLLAEIIGLLGSWRDRIPFVLLFGVATSVEMFHERLPRDTIRCLQGAKFDVEQSASVIETIFQTVVAGTDVPLRLGPNLVRMLLERQEDHVQSAQAFIAALKYAYMCHFYANPLSILLRPFKPEHKGFDHYLQPQHFEAIRHLPSFRKRVEKHLEDVRTTASGKLWARLDLENDETLHTDILLGTLEAKQKICDILGGLNLLWLCSRRSHSRLNLYIEAFSGKLADSQVVKETLNSVKQLDPGDLALLAKMLADGIQAKHLQGSVPGWTLKQIDLRAKLLGIREKALKFSKKSRESGTPIRSAYSAQSTSLRTTIVAQRVHLTKKASALSSDDKAYTSLIDTLIDLLTSMWSFPNPRDLFLSEIWLYDCLQPIKDVFMPRPRAAIERALTNPRDYLGCECCKGTEGAVSSTQPETAVLYQLYLENGALINIWDLWSAFLNIMKGGVNGDGAEDEEEDEDEGKKEREILVLFYRALADLKMLGCVKASRKKTDHLAKLAWKGL